MTFPNQTTPDWHLRFTDSHLSIFLLLNDDAVKKIGGVFSRLHVMDGKFIPLTEDFCYIPHPEGLQAGALNPPDPEVIP